MLGEALSAARGIDDAESRAKALAALAQRLPAEDQPGVLGEALSAARGIDNAWPRAEALAAVAQRLPAEEGLAVARGIDDAGSRAKALAALAQRLPAEDQPGVFGEALSAARGIDVAWSRARALAAVAERLPAEEGLAVARGIGGSSWPDWMRVEALAALARRLGPGQIPELSTHQWIEMARTLATRQRDDCIRDFTAILPFIQTLGGEQAIRSLGRSIVSVGAWWP